MGKKQSIPLGSVVVVIALAVFFVVSVVIPMIGGKGKSVRDIANEVTGIEKRIASLVDRITEIEEMSTTLYLYIDEEDKTVSKNEASNAWIYLSKYAEDAHSLLDNLSFFFYELNEDYEIVSK